MLHVPLGSKDSSWLSAFTHARWACREAGPSAEMSKAGSYGPRVTVSPSEYSFTSTELVIAEASVATMKKAAQTATAAVTQAE